MFLRLFKVKPNYALLSKNSTKILQYYSITVAPITRFLQQCWLSLWWAVDWWIARELLCGNVIIVSSATLERNWWFINIFLSRMDHHASYLSHMCLFVTCVCLSHVSVTPLQHRTVLFACLLSGSATTTGRLLDPKIASASFLSQVKFIYRSIQNAQKETAKDNSVTYSQPYLIASL